MEDRICRQEGAAGRGRSLPQGQMLSLAGFLLIGWSSGEGTKKKRKRGEVA